MANDHVKMFTEEYSPIAVQVSKQTGIAPSVLLAQWGMESEYGRKPVGHFNFGNVKDLSGTGNVGVDNKTKSKDKYLNFESPEAFGDYYANLMRRLYPNALNAGSDVSKYTEGLRSGVKGSYFEDEKYEDKLRGAHKLTSNFYADVGDATEAKEPSRYETYESEATKLRKEQEAKDEEARLNPPPPKPKTLLDSAIESANKIDPETAALVGAGANAILPAFTDPKITPKIDTGKAQEANLTAQDKLELARRNLENAVPQGAENLEETYRQSQGELERLKNEQRLAQERLKAMPKTAPIVETPAPSSLISQIDLTRTGPASGPKIEGDSSARNWTIKTAGQKHQMPEAVLDAVTDQTSESKTGGMRLIRQDLANIEKIKQLGAGDFGLVTTEGGVQLQLPPTTVAERQADIDKQNQANQAELAQRAEQARLQQEAQAQQLEQQRLANEADLERVRQERAQLGQRHNAITGQTRAAAPLQRALTKAETDAEIASRKLARAQQQPNAAGRLLEKAGVATTGPAKAGALPRAFTGAGATYLGVMSYQEALERFKAGDTSEGVLKALQAGSAAAAMLPPAGKGMTKARGAGALGMAGTYGYEGVRRLLKDRPPE
jgi:hypothetical protein